MKNQEFSISDINDDLIQYVDRYLKKVIINANHHYYHENSQMKKHGIVFVDLETLTNTLGKEDEDLESIFCQYIEVQGFHVPVYNTELAMALLDLTEMQRTILIQNVVLNITLKQIAQEIKISERMVRKHKHNAIESVRKRMKRSYET